MFGDLSILGFLKHRMHWHEARQSLLAQNIANADTPAYRPRDLKPASFAQYLGAGGSLQLAAARTHPAHLGEAAREGTAGFAPVAEDSWETTPGGNAVVLEEEMMKVAQNQFDYQLATTLYARSLGLLRSALGRTG